MQNQYHIAVKIQDALKSDNPIFWEHRARLRGTTPEQERQSFVDAAEAGARVAQFYLEEECDNFDDLTGCRGHLVNEAES